MIKFVGLRAKTYSYLADDSSEDKKAKSTKKCFKRKLERKLKFKSYKINYLEKNKIDIVSFATKENIKNS